MFTVATFNVKDLFDPAFGEKLDDLAKHITRANADVIAFQEVASEEAFAGVLARVKDGDAYKTRIIAPPDRRGIRNALVSRIPVLAQHVHVATEISYPTFVEGDPQPFPGRIPLRRGIVHATVDAPGLGSTEIFVAHFKSKRLTPLLLADGTEVLAATQVERAEGEMRSLISRSAEALYLRRLVDEAELRGPRVIVAGDLNDTIDSVPVRIVKGRGDARLHSCSSAIAREQRFSVIHGTWREQIDHLLVTQSLRDVLEEAKFMNEELEESGPYMEDAPPTIKSDHALFVATFKDAPSLAPSDPAVTQRSA